MAYESVTLNCPLEILEIVTIHYFEYSSDFSFAGESHDFWEFLCVDKGEVDVMANEKACSLCRDDIIFHQPNEFHRLAANKKTAPNLVVVAFVCTSCAMDFFREKTLKIDSYDRNLLAVVIDEAQKTFKEPLNNPYQTQMVRRDALPFAGEQLIKNHLELLLIHLIRKYSCQASAFLKREPVKLSQDDENYKRIIAYLSSHLTEQLTIEQIVKGTLTSKSRLQCLIKEKQGCGVIELFTKMKIMEARQLIRENRLNFTEISEALGYTSTHYFSRQFKKITGMTPSEYSSSIKSLSELPADHSNP